MKKLLVTLSLVALLTGCATDSTALSEYEQKLQWVKDANAIEDATAALSKGDFRLMAMAQRGIVIPGIDKDQRNQYELKCGIKLIDGISDTVRSQEHLKLMKMAQSYAKKYNAVIKQHCKP